MHDVSFGGDRPEREGRLVIRAMALALAVLPVLAGCGFLPGGSTPREDDPNATPPTAPEAAVVWSSLDWQGVSFDQPAKVAGEQWDQATAVAAGHGGFVAVGSNSDVMGYVGRIWRSADALDWRFIESPLLRDLELVDVAAGVDGFVAIGTRNVANSIDDPVTSILTSTDGGAWIEADAIAGAWAADVAVGPQGFLIIVQSALGDTTSLLMSPDGSSWTQVPAGDVAAGAWISGVAWANDSWLAAGSVGARAAVWRSSDGTTWAEEPLPAAEPIEGLMDVSAYDVVPGRWATIVLGVERAPSCAEDDDWCPKYQTGWSWTAQTGWARLPKSTWFLNRGCCVDLYPAGPAGFLYYLSSDAMLSADGWAWTPVRESGTSEAFASDIVVTEDRVVGVGWGSGPDLTGWFGSALVSP